MGKSHLSPIYEGKGHLSRGKSRLRIGGRGPSLRTWRRRGGARGRAYSGWQSILKLTSWISGTNSSSLERERDPLFELGEGEEEGGVVREVTQSRSFVEKSHLLYMDTPIDGRVEREEPFMNRWARTLSSNLAKERRSAGSFLLGLAVYP